MTMNRIAAVTLIFILASTGWWILGTATTERSASMNGRLSEAMGNLWGDALVQHAPKITVRIPGSERSRMIMPAANDITVDLQAEHRKKGLIWYPTYVCKFDGSYSITNTESVAQKIKIHFDFPNPSGTYKNFVMNIGDTPVSMLVNTTEGMREIIELAPGKTTTFRVAYETRGMGTWEYATNAQIGRVQNFDLQVNTNFANVDYPEGTMSPMASVDNATGKAMTWQSTDLITRERIGVSIPERLNPGPVTSRITFFAPVCLLFFFVLISAIGVVNNINIHPMHYFFVAAGFFAFHLLLAYLVDVINIHIAFFIATLVTTGLVTTYLQAALKKQLPWKIVLGGQLFYLILFSYSFFLKGVTGLTIAIGSVLTLAVLMKVTAHLDWDKVFESKKKASPAPKPAAPAKVPPLPTT